MRGRIMSFDTADQRLLEAVAVNLRKLLGVRVDLTGKQEIGRWTALSRAYHPRETGIPGHAILIGFATEANLPVNKMVKVVSRMRDVEFVHHGTFQMGVWTLIVWEDEYERGEDLVREFAKITGQTISRSK